MYKIQQGLPVAVTMKERDTSVQHDGPYVTLLGEDLQEVLEINVGGGRACLFTCRSPGKPTTNEDSSLACSLGSGLGVLAVADGFGGEPAGEQASQLAIQSLHAAVHSGFEAGGDLRAGILDGFERANQAVSALGLGACTTLTVLEINGSRIRPYHVGDSEILVFGRGGKIRLQIVSHSPVGYGVEAGLIDQQEAIHHEDRHLVSNMVGTPAMRIEVGALLELRPNDTVVLASDGLFDNLFVDEIVQRARKGPLKQAATALRAECDKRMRTPTDGQPSKPDDLTFLLFRPT